MTQCEETGAPFKIAGPVWLGCLDDKNVVAEALKRLETKEDTKWMATKKQLRGLLISCREELEDVSLYCRIPDLARAVSGRQACVQKRCMTRSRKNYAYRECSSAYKTSTW